MTPEQLLLVQTSADALLASADAWSDAFYRRLFEAHPDVRSMFADDLTAQRGKFVAEIAALLGMVADLDRFEDRAARLGAEHVGLGVRAAHYRATRDALIAAIADVLGPEATPEVLEAWTAVHDLVAEAMLTGRPRSSAVPSA